MAYQTAYFVAIKINGLLRTVTSERSTAGCRPISGSLPMRGVFVKRYVRADFPHLNDYTAYYEYDGEWVTRQIDLFPETVLLLVPPEASDARFSDVAHVPSQMISHQTFNELWERYAAQPHGTKRTDSPLLKAPWFVRGEPG